MERARRDGAYTHARPGDDERLASRDLARLNDDGGGRRHGGGNGASRRASERCGRLRRRYWLRRKLRLGGKLWLQVADRPRARDGCRLLGWESDRTCYIGAEGVRQRAPVHRPLIPGSRIRRRTALAVVITLRLVYIIACCHISVVRAGARSATSAVPSRSCSGEAAASRQVVTYEYRLKYPLLAFCVCEILLIAVGATARASGP